MGLCTKKYTCSNNCSNLENWIWENKNLLAQKPKCFINGQVGQKKT